MSKIIILISATVIVINFLYTMLPCGSYEKYCKHIWGLILILIFAGTITKFDISSDVLNFDENIPVFENVKITEVAQSQVESLICENIKNMLKSQKIKLKNIQVKMENNNLSKVKITLYEQDNKNEIISMIASFCDINKENIVVE